MAGPNGGSRPGSGRKSKREQHKGAIVRAERRIRDRLPELIDNLFALASGVTVRDETKDGPRIYAEPPCYKSNEYLINRVMGKPTERAEIGGKGGGTLRVEVVYADMEAPPDAGHPPDAAEAAPRPA